MRLAVVIAMVATGCVSARVIQQEPRSGVIQLDGDHSRAMEEATHLMQRHCKGPYTILSDALEVDGSIEDDEGSAPRSSDPRASTRAGTAWRVRYECGVATPSTASP